MAEQAKSTAKRVVSARFIVNAGLLRRSRFLVGFILLFLIWELAVESGVKEYILPSPVSVAQGFFDQWPNLLNNAWDTTLEIIAGYALAIVVSIPLALLIAFSRVAEETVYPLVVFLQIVPKIAVAPLFIIWFGFGFTSKAFLVGLAVFLVVIVYAVDGCRRIPDDLARTAAMLGMNRRQRFRNLILPGTLVEVLIGARVSLMSGWGTVIVAELVAANSGLGAHLISVQQSYDVAAVVATMICFGVTGFAMNALFSAAEERLLPWRRITQPDAHA